MMKKVMRTLCFLLSTILLMCSSPAVLAKNEVLSSNITWKVEDTTLHFDGSGEMTLTYEYLEELPWYEQRNTVDTVIVSEGITSLGEGVLTAFRKLETVVLPESLTTIGTCAFLSCERLTQIVLPDRVTKIESGAFVGCEALSSISIPGNVYEISSNAFYNCTNATIVGIKGSYAEEFAKEHNIPFDASRPLPAEIMVSLNHRLLTFDQPPLIIDDRTLVPVRAIFEAMGVTVDWIPATRTVTAKRGNTSIKMVIDTKILVKNGTNIEIDVPAQIINERTLVPARAIAEAFGASVNWNPDTRTVIIDD